VSQLDYSGGIKKGLSTCRANACRNGFCCFGGNELGNDRSNKTVKKIWGLPQGAWAPLSNKSTQGAFAFRKLEKSLEPQVIPSIMDGHIRLVRIRQPD
jgi:hypothetical protein